MGQKRGRKFGDLRQSLTEIAFRDGGKFRDAAIDQKAFETEASGAPESGEFLGISGDEASPEADVDEEFVCGGAEFFVKAGEGSCGGNTVEGHFDERGDAAGSGGTRRSGEAL